MTAPGRRPPLAGIVLTLLLAGAATLAWVLMARGVPLRLSTVTARVELTGSTPELDGFTLPVAGTAGIRLHTGGQPGEWLLTATAVEARKHLALGPVRSVIRPRITAAALADRLNAALAARGAAARCTAVDGWPPAPVATR